MLSLLLCPSAQQTNSQWTGMSLLTATVPAASTGAAIGTAAELGATLKAITTRGGPCEPRTVSALTNAAGF